MKKYPILVLCTVLILSIGLVLAVPNLTSKQAEVNPSKGHATVVIPAHAVKVAPGVFSLGTALDSSGGKVQGYMFIDYKKGFAKPGTVCGNGVCEPSENKNNCPQDCANGGEEPDTSSCYGFLARGAKWKTVENYMVNPSNTEGLGPMFVMNNLAADVGKWETAAGVNIIGTGSIANQTLVADTVTPDNKNEVYFGDIAESGAIGVTIIWGIFLGPPSKRELVEWDQVYDQADFDWSATGEAGKMDFENIATHELGHSVGLGDLYTDGCSEQTMYGYADYGETKKRSLEDGDKAGVKALYK